MKRRKLLTRLGLLATASVIPVSSWVARKTTLAAQNKKLIVILLRGGVDGLNIVVPYQDPNYHQARPSLALGLPQEQNGVIDLDGYFGLHPDLSGIMPLWREKTLAFVHACGSPDPSRSHFQAQDYLENGTPGNISTSTGWLNRLLSLFPADNPTQAVNVGETTPLILTGQSSVVNLSPQKQGNHSPMNSIAIQKAFDQLYNGNDTLSLAYREGRAAQEILLAELTQEMNQASKDGQKASNLAINARKMAKLMRGEAHTQVGFLAVGGWDTHIHQQRSLSNSLKGLSQGLTTLVDELKPIYNQTLIVVLSEFGRTVKENGNQGTDHGHGNVMWLLGGNLPGGKVYGEWLGLEESQLYQQRDLPVTTDFRQVLWPLLSEHFQLNSNQMSQVFPGYSLPQKSVF